MDFALQRFRKHNWDLRLPGLLRSLADINNLWYANGAPLEPIFATCFFLVPTSFSLLDLCALVLRQAGPHLQLVQQHRPPLSVNCRLMTGSAGADTNKKARSNYLSPGRKSVGPTAFTVMGREDPYLILLSAYRNWLILLHRVFETLKKLHT